MLRTILVLVLAAFGFAYMFQGAFAALLVYLWVAYFRPEAWVWDPTLLRSFNLSYVAGVGVVVLTMFSRERSNPGIRVGLLVAFLVHALVSTALAPHADWAWFYWLDFLKVVIITVLIATLVTDARKFRLALLVLAVSLAFEPAKQGWVGLLMSPGSENSNAHVMLGDNNGVAVGMMMLVPIFLMLASTAATWQERWIHRMFGFGVLYHGLVTYSRGGFLAAAALGMVFLWRSPKKVPVLAGMLALSLVVIPVLPQAFWQRMGTISSVDKPDEADGSVLGRLHFWSVAVTMANANPVFGVGHNSYNVEYDRYDDSDGAFGRGRSVHSVWFGIVSELGYPALILFLILLGLGFRACAQARKAARANPECAVLAKYAIALEGALIAYTVGASFLPFQYLEMYWHLLGFTIALSTLASNALAEEKAKIRAAAPPVGVSAVPMGLAS